MKWIFGRPNLSRADILVAIGVFISFNSGYLPWWGVFCILVPWAVVSVAIEMIVFGDDYVTKGRWK